MAVGIACLRVAVGVGLAVAPRRVLTKQLTQEPSGPIVLMTRTVGIRDLVLGVGAASAARSNDVPDLKRWIVVGLLSDLFDVALGACSTRSIGKQRAMVTALVPVPVILADVWALSLLGERKG